MHRLAKTNHMAWLQRPTRHLGSGVCSSCRSISLHFCNFVVIVKYIGVLRGRGERSQPKKAYSSATDCAHEPSLHGISDKCGMVLSPTYTPFSKSIFLINICNLRRSLDQQFGEPLKPYRIVATATMNMKRLANEREGWLVGQDQDLVCDQLGILRFLA